MQHLQENWDEKTVYFMFVDDTFYKTDYISIEIVIFSKKQLISLKKKLMLFFEKKNL